MCLEFPAPITSPMCKPMRKLTEEELKERNEQKEQVRNELRQALSAYGEVSQFQGYLYLQAHTKSGFRLQATFFFDPVATPVTLSGYISDPANWKNRLKVSLNFTRITLEEFLTTWTGLIDESETVLTPEPESTIYETEDAQRILGDVLADLQLLMDVCPTTVQTESSKALAKELQIILSNDPTLDETPEGSSARLCTYLGGLTARWYLFEYKDHYFILADIGGSCWSYISTVQEFMLDFSWDHHFKLSNQ